MKTIDLHVMLFSAHLKTMKYPLEMFFDLLTFTHKLDLDNNPLDLHAEIQVCMSVRPPLRVRHIPPGETRGIHVKSVTFLFKTRGELTEFTWFVRWDEIVSKLLHLLLMREVIHLILSYYPFYIPILVIS